MDRPEKGSDKSTRVPEALAAVSEALSRLRYGAVRITVHDGMVKQFDVTQKKRLAD